MDTCWYCDERPADPDKARRNVLLHRGSEERTVTVPVCRTCAAARRNRWIVAVVVFLLGFGASIAAAELLVAADDPGSTRAAVFFGGVAVTGMAVGVVSVVIPRRVGMKALGPQWSRHGLQGWSEGHAPPGVQTQKKCSRCGRAVPTSARPGDSCPHCGVRWGYETFVQK